MPAPDAGAVRRELRRLADPERAHTLQRFFKTGPGEYGEGDRFLGLRVPQVRKLAKRVRALSLSETVKLLRSPYHEERLFALLLMVGRYRDGDAAVRKRVFEIYLRNTRYINNWDLVDVSAPHIVGDFLDGESLDVLDRLAQSESLWERRIAIMATFHFIRQDRFAPTVRIAKKLLTDEQDLIHKAVGWMLREVGKRDIDTERRFLDRHYRRMPRTMVRYAIERFPPRERARYR